MKRDVSSAVEPVLAAQLPPLEPLPGPFVGSPEWWASREGVSPVVACTAEEDMARQEYALQSEIGYQISRFGVGHPVQFGQVDYDNMDRTRAMELLREAELAWAALPKVIRDRYQSWSAVEAAAASGELDQVLKAAGAAPVSGAASAASPSESAAGDTPKGS